MESSRGDAFTATMARHFMKCVDQHSDIVRSALTRRTAHHLRDFPACEEQRAGSGRPVSRCIRLCRRPSGWLPYIAGSDYQSDSKQSS